MIIDVIWHASKDIYMIKSDAMKNRNKIEVES